ncbi:hypothetical protein [Daejeonella oryzae]|uniref:hypothetical protein n=1 Tax=Daejeonella oryzae TaxID=1122943 RepID=UPI00041B887F|nr:hypothetical protein [Daejeonella oryzae]
MKDLLEEVRHGLKERLRNPFAGAFCLSWIAFNWKAVFSIFLSTKPIEGRISYVSANFSDLNHLLFLAFIVAVVYLIVLPYISLALETALTHSSNRRSVISLKQKKLRISQETEIEIERIKREKAKAEFREQDQFNKEVRDLKSQLLAANERAAKDKYDYSSLVKVLQDQNTKTQEDMIESAKRFDESLSVLRKEKDADILRSQTLLHESQSTKLALEVKISSLSVEKDRLLKELQQTNDKGLGNDRPMNNSSLSVGSPAIAAAGHFIKDKKFKDE